MKAEFIPYRLIFKRPAGTSRGTLHYKDTFFIVLRDGDNTAIGESALFRGLSADDRPGYEKKLSNVIREINSGKPVDLTNLKEWPSIVFGLESAFKSLNSTQPEILFPSAFTKGKASIPINGLIWMGSKDFMFEQIKEKIEKGFRVIKLKIGAIDFDEEIELIKFIRQQFSADTIEIRLDANGAFSPEDAPEKIKRLSDFHIHSIEQPIKPGQRDEMALLCEQSPIPIALDEELIGIYDSHQKEELLQHIKPQFIILKPSLVGGFSGTDKWIKWAETNRTGWWITSALESNIGLNAIAQYTYTKNVRIPQGLGTGGLFVNNIPSPLYLIRDGLHFDPRKKIEWPPTNNSQI